MIEANEKGAGKTSGVPPAHLGFLDLEELRRAAMSGIGLDELAWSKDARLYGLTLHALSCGRCRELLYTVVFGAEAEAGLLEEKADPGAEAAGASLCLERAGNGMRVVEASGLAPAGEWKGFPPGLPVAAVSRLAFKGRGPSGSFNLTLEEAGRSVSLTFPEDPRASVRAADQGVEVSRQRPGRFSADLGKDLLLVIRSGSGGSQTLSLSAVDVAEISDAPALLAIYADAASGRRESASLLQMRRRSVLSGLKGEESGFFAAALDALTLGAAPLTLHLGGKRPSEGLRRQWKDVLSSLVLAGHLNELASLPFLLPFKGELDRVSGLVSDGLVNEAQGRLNIVIEGLLKSASSTGAEQQALAFLYALSGWLGVCREEYEKALSSFNRALAFYREHPAADLAPWAQSARYFADMGGRVAERLMREPETPFREAVFSSLINCIA